MSASSVRTFCLLYNWQLNSCEEQHEYWIDWRGSWQDTIDIMTEDDPRLTKVSLCLDFHETSKHVNQWNIFPLNILLMMRMMFAKKKSFPSCSTQQQWSNGQISDEILILSFHHLIPKITLSSQLMTSSHSSPKIFCNQS